MECTVFPLLEILPAPDPRIVAEAARNLQPYALVVFASPSAVSAFASFLETWPLDVAIGVMGKGSARRLQHEFTPPHCRRALAKSRARIRRMMKCWKPRYRFATACKDKPLPFDDCCELYPLAMAFAVEPTWHGELQ